MFRAFSPPLAWVGFPQYLATPFCGKGRIASPNSQTFGILLHIFQICRHLPECDGNGDHDALTSAKVPPCAAGTETYRRGGAGVANVRDSHKRADVGRGFSHRLFSFRLCFSRRGATSCGTRVSTSRVGVVGPKTNPPYRKSSFSNFII